jgi:PKD repeat protein
MHISRMNRTSHLGVMAAMCAVAVLGGCTVHEQSAPGLAGPSGFALSLGLTATPDTIQRDGTSISRIAVFARDESGAAVQRQVILTTNAGRLSSDSVTTTTVTTTTDVNRPATVDFIAPNRNESVEFVTITASAVGVDYANSQSTTLKIRVLGPGVPVARFTVTPEVPAPGAQAVFDGSASTVGFGANLVTYVWNFGDGDSAQGAIVTKQFDSAGTYPVTLRVTDDLGRIATKTIAVIVLEPVVPAEEDMP